MLGWQARISNAAGLFEAYTALAIGADMITTGIQTGASTKLICICERGGPFATDWIVRHVNRRKHINMLTGRQISNDEWKTFQDKSEVARKPRTASLKQQESRRQEAAGRREQQGGIPPQPPPGPLLPVLPSSQAVCHSCAGHFYVVPGAPVTFCTHSGQRNYMAGANGVAFGVPVLSVCHVVFGAMK